MKTQTFGVEIELTGISRKNAAKVIGEYFGTTPNHIGGGYDTHAVTDNQGRTWKLMNDSSINAEGHPRGESYEYQCEMVTPICRWEDITVIQEIVRKLRENGAVANSSCGIHVHVGAEQHTAKTLRNLVNIMASKEDLLFKALKVRRSREDEYCHKTDEGFVEKMNKRKPTDKMVLENLWYEGYENRYSSRTSHYNSSRYHALNLHSLWQGKGIEFRCFNGTTHAGKIKTYIQLCLAISHQALTQHGASAKKTASANEKYTFRTWLLRMGMIGEEFETARMWLLKDLNGDIAFRNGRPRAVV